MYFVNFGESEGRALDYMFSRFCSAFGLQANALWAAREALVSGAPLKILRLRLTGWSLGFGALFCHSILI